jgi:hypothetical protein
VQKVVEILHRECKRNRARPSGSSRLTGDLLVRSGGRSGRNVVQTVEGAILPITVAAIRKCPAGWWEASSVSQSTSLLHRISERYFESRISIFPFPLSPREEANGQQRANANVEDRFRRALVEHCPRLLARPCGLLVMWSMLGGRRCLRQVLTNY